MKIKELILKAYNKKEITKNEEREIFRYLRHIPNKIKTDEEFELYCKMAKEKGLPEPDRDSMIRPLYEHTNCAFINKKGKWEMKNS